MESFEDNLVLKDFFFDLFGADSFDDFQDVLQECEEGYRPDNRSEFALTIANSEKLNLDDFIRENLETYDRNIREYEENLNRNRDEEISWKYFQWLSLLFTEVYLDLYFGKYDNYGDKLNEEFSGFVADRNAEKEENDLLENQVEDNIGKISYWMATGAGKTLIMHANFWQYKKYSDNDLDNVLLITPNEGLTEQHLDNFEASDIEAAEFEPENSDDSSDVEISVLDIYKLREDNSGDKTYPLDLFEGDNLVFVDEGHKGAQGNTWMSNREEVIGDKGLSFEYSATFGQALNNIENEKVQNRYVQSIIFRYSFDKFHNDGFGKDYSILNYDDENDGLRQKYLVGSLLSFYEQKKYYSENESKLEDFNLDDPLWIFVGQTVNATPRNEVTQDEKVSDVESVVRFLNYVLENKDEVISRIEDIVYGSDADLLDEKGKDLFEDRFEYLRESNLSSEDMYYEILEKIFNVGSNPELTVVRLKGTDGEVGLRVGNNKDYFGVVSIGDTKSFADRIEEESEIRVQEQDFRKSLFENIDEDDSTVNVLIGAKKFVEGWDSYRVSNMGLMRVGQSEGSEIIQIFGRGIRLRGYGHNLKRSTHTDIEPEKIPENIGILERLNIFGVESGYIEEFENQLEDEDITTSYVERKTKTKVNSDLVNNNLKVPRVQDDLDYTSETSLKLEADQEYAPKIDLYSKVQTLRSEDVDSLDIERNELGVSDNRFNQAIELADWDYIFIDLVDYKERKNYSNLVLSQEELEEVITEGLFSLYCPEGRIPSSNLIRQKEKFEEIFKMILRSYIDNFYKSRKSDWEDKRRKLETLNDKDPELNYELKFKVPEDEEDVLGQIESLIENPETEAGKYIKKFDRSLYEPLFLKEKMTDWKAANDVSLPAQALNEDEERLVNKLESLCKDGSLDKNSVYLLRNPRNTGIGFSQGGYPDFLLWIKDGNKQKLIFLDPHGVFHELGSNGKVEDLSDLNKVKLKDRVKEIENNLSSTIELSSYVLSSTKDKNLPFELTQSNKKKMIEQNFYPKRKDNLKNILKEQNIIG